MHCIHKHTDTHTQMRVDSIGNSSRWLWYEAGAALTTAALTHTLMHVLLCLQLVVYNHPAPVDVVQGQLGNCWFMGYVKKANRCILFSPLSLSLCVFVRMCDQAHFVPHLLSYALIPFLLFQHRALAVLAEREHLIERIFFAKESSPFGVYQVRVPECVCALNMRVRAFECLCMCTCPYLKAPLLLLLPLLPV